MPTDKSKTPSTAPHPRSSASIRGSHTDLEPRINADRHGLILKTETEAIVGCAFEVLNELGHGLLEKPYENALVVEFGLRSISCEQQRRYDVLYKSVKVGEYVPDLIAFGCVVVDTKVIDHITDHELGQMLNYLKITGHPVGLILNFRRARLEWKRVVNTNHRKS
ncbi:MAG: GxxExxY protein [Opitutales bacterium]|nr:GxxExxY protein [Opitutales bacterium]